MIFRHLRGAMGVFLALSLMFSGFLTPVELLPTAIWTLILCFFP